MRIDDVLFFAPGIPFYAVDTTNSSLVQHFRQRIEGYYLSPAQELAGGNHALPAGVLLASAVDALARYDPRCVASNTRYTDWLTRELASFRDRAHSKRFYDDFRCGLVHEGRIKNGSEFSGAFPETVHLEDGVMVVNPLYFHAEAIDALDRFSDYLSDSTAFTTFRSQILDDFQHEIAHSCIAQNA